MEVLRRRGTTAALPESPFGRGSAANGSLEGLEGSMDSRGSGRRGEKGGARVRGTANSTGTQKGVHSRSLVPSSPKVTELSIEALYAPRPRERFCQDDVLPDECERARLIGDITRLLREPQMPETTRTAGLTLIGWLARRMPGEAPHAIGVAEARQSEQRLRAAQQRKR